MAGEGPILIARGSSGRHMIGARVFGFLAALTLAAGTLYTGTYLLPRLGGFLACAPWPLALVVAVLGGWLAERFVRSTQGSVAFYEARIVISKKVPGGCLSSGVVVEHTEQVLWNEVKGFKDDAAGYVTLVATCGSASFLTVPTPEEEDRVAVIALLDARGIPRIE
ncbi:MAG: hypothetical protein ACAI25_20970 [Planctomycetota bacterium]